MDIRELMDDCPLETNRGAEIRTRTKSSQRIRATITLHPAIRYLPDTYRLSDIGISDS